MLTHKGAIYRLGAATRKPSGAVLAKAGLKLKLRT